MDAVVAHNIGHCRTHSAKRIDLEKVVLFQFCFALLYNGICALFSLPTTLSYLIDVINLFVLIEILFDASRNKKIYKLRLTGVFYALVCLNLACLSTSIIHLVNPLLVVWAFRNEMRFFPFFLACVLYLSINSVERVAKLLFRLQILNVLVSLIQYFVFGYKQDNLGGIFGVTTGCNAYTNAYFCYLTVAAVCFYLRSKMSFSKMALTLLSCLLLSALAELKAFYAEFALAIILCVIFSKKSTKSVALIFISIVGLAVSYAVFSIVFSGWASQMANLSDYFNVGFAVGGGYEISRFGAVSDINDIWFHGDWVLNLFGYGFGACEISAYPIFTSPFSLAFSSYHYSWFSFQKFFLECGFLGVAAYLAVFISIFIWISRAKRKFGDNDGYGAFGQVYCLLLIVFAIYNSTLRMELGYVVYFLLASSFVYYKHRAVS